MKSLYSLIFFFALTGCKMVLHPPINPLIDEILAPVVMVEDDQGRCYGSGVILSSKKEGDQYHNILITNLHVVEYMYDRMMLTIAKVYSYNEFGLREIEPELYELSCVAVSKPTDCMIMEFTSTKKLPSVRIITDNIILGLFDEVAVVGCQSCDDPSPTFGVIGDLVHISDDGFSSIKVTGQTIYGNSGGAAYVKKDGKYYYFGITSRIGLTRHGFPIPHMNYVSPWRSIQRELEQQGVFLDLEE